MGSSLNSEQMAVSSEQLAGTAGHSHALQRFLTIRCASCWDSMIARGLYSPVICAPCVARPNPSPAAVKISEVVLARVGASKECDQQMLDAARSLANATAENPVPGDILQAHLRCDRRTLSGLMRRLRDEWQLPAIASRRPPTGYFIATTAAELLEWQRVTRSQAISELATSYRLVSANHPLLAGQQQLDFLSVVSSELQEAIR